MGKKTEIAWTGTRIADGTVAPGATFNPWWGCSKVSPGCDHCYAETLSNRFGKNIWGPDAARRFFGDKHWAEPVAWNAQAEKTGIRRKVFCGSMCDWAEGRPDQADARARLFALIETTPMLDWLLLTKRPGAIKHLIPHPWLDYPPENVWYGTSTENQEQADRRIPELLKLRASVLFLSMEPLLGPVILRTSWFYKRYGPAVQAEEWRNRIGWVIVGGESGPGARPMHPGWARDLKLQCERHEVPYFFKQWGEHLPESQIQSLPKRVRDDFFEANGEELLPSTWFVKVGKKEAGHLLDGQEHYNWPMPEEVQHATAE